MFPLILIGICAVAAVATIILIFGLVYKLSKDIYKIVEEANRSFSPIIPKVQAIERALNEEKESINSTHSNSLFHDELGIIFTSAFERDQEIQQLMRYYEGYKQELDEAKSNIDGTTNSTKENSLKIIHKFSVRYFEERKALRGTLKKNIIWLRETRAELDFISKQRVDFQSKRNNGLRDVDHIFINQTNCQIPFLLSELHQVEEIFMNLKKKVEKDGKKEFEKRVQLIVNHEPERDILDNTDLDSVIDDNFEDSEPLLV